MAEAFRYFRSGPRLEFYTEIYDYSEQHPANEPGMQPPLVRNFFPVHRSEELAFALDEPDIRGYTVNSTSGTALGTVVGYLADRANSLVPYAYIQTEDGRTVVVPTTQFMLFQNLKLVTLEGGKDVLRSAPQATWEAGDATRADQYWGEYRRQNAA